MVKTMNPIWKTIVGFIFLGFFLFGWIWGESFLAFAGYLLMSILIVLAVAVATVLFVIMVDDKNG